MVDIALLLQGSLLSLTLLGIYGSSQALSRQIKAMAGFQQNKRQLRDQDEVEVSVAIERLKKKALLNANKRASEPQLVHGMVTRGQTVARSNLSKKGRSISEQAEHDRNKAPVYIRNFYRAPFLGYLIHRDIEAENFFLTDTVDDAAHNVAKVFPAMEATSNLRQEYRDCMPHDPSFARGIFYVFSMLNAFYYRDWEVVYEGDKLSIFGILTYDARTQQAQFDETLAMMTRGGKEEIIERLNLDTLYAGCAALTVAAVGAVTAWASFKLLKMISARLQHVIRQRERRELEELDRENQIEGAPPKVRSLPANLRNRPVLVDSYQCGECHQRRANILFVPCLHCVVCNVCYQQAAVKNVCGKCRARADKYLQIYMS